MDLSGVSNPICRLRVAVDAPQHSGIGAPLDYLSEQALPPGSLVQVPLGKRELTGIVWDPLPAEAEAEGQVLPDTALRPISQALLELPPLTLNWRRLLDFAASYYQRSVGEVALSVLPPQLRELDAKQLQGRLKKLHKWVAAELKDEVPSTQRPELSPAQAEVLAQLDALLLAERTADATGSAPSCPT
jgi:primosomal protein N' (replication factor Y)